MRLTTGDIGLVKVKKFSRWYRLLFARLISLFDKSYYHHAILFLGHHFEEADTEVLERSLSYYDGDTLLILELIKPLTPPEKIAYIEVAKLQLGKTYDYWGALLFQLIYRLTGIWLGSKGKKAERKPYCSEHVLTPIHHVRGYFQDKYKWSPGDIIRKGSLYYRIKWEGKFNSKDWETL